MRICHRWCLSLIFRSLVCIPWLQCIVWMPFFCLQHEVGFLSLIILCVCLCMLACVRACVHYVCLFMSWNTCIVWTPVSYALVCAQEAKRVRHCALSLVGEPIMYPEINGLISLMHSNSISTYREYSTSDNSLIALIDYHTIPTNSGYLFKSWRRFHRSGLDDFMNADSTFAWLYRPHSSVSTHALGYWRVR